MQISLYEETFASSAASAELNRAIVGKYVFQGCGWKRVLRSGGFNEIVNDLPVGSKGCLFLYLCKPVSGITGNSDVHVSSFQDS